MKPTLYHLQVDPFKNTLKHVIQNREGYMSEIKRFGERDYNRLKKSDFVKTDTVMNAETYKATSFADGYYAQLYGLADWTYQRIRGFLSHI